MAQDKTAALVITLDKEIKTIKELKQYIEELSVAVSQTAEGTEQYERGMEKLTEAQDALSKATSLMKAQNTSAKDSYYALNKQLSESKKAYKNLTEEERKNAEVGGKLIKSISALDDQLKEMDAKMGDHHRSVGDYTDSIKKAFDGVGLSSVGLGKVVKGLDVSFRVFSTNPVMALFTLLLPLITKIVEKVRQAGAVTKSLNNVMDSLQPIMDLTTIVVAKVAEVFAKLADKVALVVNLLFKNKRDSLHEAATRASSAVGGFAEQTEKATEKVDELAASLEKIREELDEDAYALAADSALWNEWNAEQDKIAKDKEARAKEEARIRKELRKIEEQEEEWREEAAHNDLVRAEKREQMLKEQMQTEIDTRKRALTESYTATISIMGAIADIYEANADEDEKAAKKAKAIRIASTIIETLSGATAAYMNSVKAYKSNPALGITMGALNAAVVTAAGMANIAKMKSTTASSTSAVSATTATSAVSAPSVSRAEIPTAVVTGASQSSVNTRAYIVWSDLEGAMGQASGTESETSW